MMKIKIAVIIKHAFRDFDYRVDIIEVEEDEIKGTPSLYDRVSSRLLGPFEIVAITERINLKATY